MSIDWTYQWDMSEKAENLDMLGWRAEQPHNALPLLPPQADLETKRVLKACIAARVALAELRQTAELLPNPSVLINTLPLLEAKASSEIENIVTTADKLFQHANDATAADPATQEALRYRQALMTGYQSLHQRPITTQTAEAVCTTIKGIEMRVRRLPGTKLLNNVTGTVVYTPPEGEQQLRELLTDWERFMHNETELDPLVRLAVAHYQFEAIHPFADGNGRTGRVLNTLFLVEQKLLTLPILNLSRYINEHRSEYYRLLLAVTRDSAWEEWLLYMLRGVEETSLWTSAKIGAVRNLFDDTRTFVRSTLPKIYSRELVDVIFEQPYCRITMLTNRDIAKRETASNYLKSLTAVGVLNQLRVGRERLFVNTRLMALLTRDSNTYTPFG